MNDKNRLFRVENLVASLAINMAVVSDSMNGFSGISRVDFDNSVVRDKNIALEILGLEKEAK